MRLFIVVAIIASTIFPASAQWFSQKSTSDFADDVTHVALSISGEYGFGIRCTSKDIYVVLATPERTNSETIETFNLFGSDVRIRVDGGAILDLDAVPKDVDGKLVVTASADVDLLRSIASAKTRISVAIGLNGKNFHETAFGVVGSKKVISELIKGCNLED